MNMSQYSRSNKNQKPEEKVDTRPSRGEKVKQGLSVFQTVVAPALSWFTIRDLTPALPIQMLTPIRRPIQVIQMLVHKKKPIAHLLQKPVHLPHKTKAPQQQTVEQIQHHLEPTKKTVRTTLLIFFGFRFQLFLIFIESIYLIVILPFEL